MEENLKFTKEELEETISALEGNIGCMVEMGYQKLPNDHSGYPKRQQEEKRKSLDNSLKALEKFKIILNQMESINVPVCLRNSKERTQE